MVIIITKKLLVAILSYNKQDNGNTIINLFTLPIDKVVYIELNIIYVMGLSTENHVKMGFDKKCGLFGFHGVA